MEGPRDQPGGLRPQGAPPVTSDRAEARPRRLPGGSLPSALPLLPARLSNRSVPGAEKGAVCVCVFWGGDPASPRGVPGPQAACQANKGAERGAGSRVQPFAAPRRSPPPSSPFPAGAGSGSPRSRHHRQHHTTTASTTPGPRWGRAGCGLWAAGRGGRRAGSPAGALPGAPRCSTRVSALPQGKPGAGGETGGGGRGGGGGLGAPERRWGRGRGAAPRGC